MNLKLFLTEWPLIYLCRFFKGLKRCTGISILHTFMNPREIKDAQFIAGEVEAWCGSEEGHAFSVEQTHLQCSGISLYHPDWGGYYRINKEIPGVTGHRPLCESVLWLFCCTTSLIVCITELTLHSLWGHFTLYHRLGTPLRYIPDVGYLVENLRAKFHSITAVIPLVLINKGIRICSCLYLDEKPLGKLDKVLGEEGRRFTGGKENGIRPRDD